MRKYNLKIKIIKLIMSFVFFLAFVFLAVIFFKVSTLEKFIYVNNKDGNAEIIIVDSKKNNTTKIFIDKDFKLESTRNLGEYKLGSLWILGEKEKYQGKLLSETITKNFAIPIYLWKNEKYSNLNLYQKIKVYLITRRSKNDYDYSLTTKILKDTVLVNFTDPFVADNLPKVRIEDLTGGYGQVNIISKILNIIGFKTVDYFKGYDEKLDCEVIGKNKLYNKIVANIFTCEDKIDLNKPWDLELRVGKIFADRF